MDGKIISITSPSNSNDQLAIYFDEEELDAKIERVQMWALIEIDGKTNIEGIAFKRDGSYRVCTQQENFAGYARTEAEADEIVQVLIQLKELDKEEAEEIERARQEQSK